MTAAGGDAARPARRKARRPASSMQKQATESLFKGLDRFGLAPVLLIGLAWVGHTQVVVPIATAYANMVKTVGDTNQMLRESIDRNNREDGERVRLLTLANEELRRVSEENRTLNQRILARIDELENDLNGKP